LTPVSRSDHLVTRKRPSLDRALLGAGGMGEGARAAWLPRAVHDPPGAGGGSSHRGRDSKLDRDVAIKKWARASREPISLKIQIRGSPLENRLYCLL